MSLLLLALGIAACLLFATFCGLRWPGLGGPVFAAAAIRIPVGFVGFYAVPFRLPYSGHDAVGFERAAWEIASGGWISVLDALNPLTGFHMVAPFSLIYALVGREPHALLMYNVILGVAVVPLVYGITTLAAGPRTGRRAAWVMALFPAAILMSSLILREAGVAFGVGVGLLGVIGVMRGRSPLWLIPAVGGLGLASLLHGGILVPSLALLVFLSLSQFRATAEGSKVRLRAAVTGVMGAVLLVGAVWVTTSNQIRFASFGQLDLESAEARILSQNARDGMGGSAYYDGVATRSWGQAGAQAPVRIGLFMFSPLPWTVRSGTQVIGLLDALIWLGMIGLLVVRWKVWWSDPVLRALAVFAVVAIIVYAFGTTNAGTALRHRTKITPVLLPLVVILLSYRQHDAAQAQNREPAVRPLSVRMS